MKILSLLVLCILPAFLYSQSGHTHTTPKGNKYPYEYSFTLTLLDSSYANLQKIKGARKSVITVENDYGDTPLYVQYTLTNLATQEQLNLQSTGPQQLQIHPGEYELEARCFACQTYHIRFTLENNEGIHLHIVMMEYPELGGYKIHAKKPLTEDEIRIIKDCVKERKKNPSIKCEKKGHYYVLMVM